MSISCVYEIFCIPTKRKYIGSTKDFDKRKHIHLTELKNQRHHNYKLQSVYDKYGEKAFAFSVLEECEANVLLDREQYYIDINSKIYNVTRSARHSSVAAYYENVAIPYVENEKYPIISTKKKKEILSFKRDIAVRKFNITPKYYELLKRGLA